MIDFPAPSIAPQWEALHVEINGGLVLCRHDLRQPPHPYFRKDGRLHRVAAWLEQDAPEGVRYHYCGDQIAVDIRARDDGSAGAFVIPVCRSARVPDKRVLGRVCRELWRWGGSRGLPYGWEWIATPDGDAETPPIGQTFRLRRCEDEAGPCDKTFAVLRWDGENWRSKVEMHGELAAPLGVMVRWIEGAAESSGWLWRVQRRIGE